MSALLALEQVSKSYRRGAGLLRVLTDASLEVDAGEVVCVLGSRGQGKTTLLRIAAGMESVDSGRALFSGMDLGHLSDQELSRLLGDSIAWAGPDGPGIAVSMLDYVAMPLLARRRDGLLHALRGGGRSEGRRECAARAHAALERVGASSCARQHWDEISNWERALVELAQAIAGEPALVLIDDLTDTLGIRETDALTALVRELSRERGLSVLMGASDGQAMLHCDRIVTLMAGSLVGSPSGEPAEVITLAGSDKRRLRREHGGA